MEQTVTVRLRDPAPQPELMEVVKTLGAAIAMRLDEQNGGIAVWDRNDAPPRVPYLQRNLVLEIPFGGTTYSLSYDAYVPAPLSKSGRNEARPLLFAERPERHLSSGAMKIAYGWAPDAKEGIYYGGIFCVQGNSGTYFLPNRDEALKFIEHVRSGLGPAVQAVIDLEVARQLAQTAAQTELDTRAKAEDLAIKEDLASLLELAKQ